MKHSHEFLFDRNSGRPEECAVCLLPKSHKVHASVGSGVQTTCIEHAYGSTERLSFQIKVF